MSDIVNLNDILSNISSEFNIPIGDLMKYSSKKCKKKNCLCKARKQDGLQCTRRSRPNSMFCGKHISKRNYGCVSDEESVECRVIKESNISYFVDDYGIVYSKHPDIPDKFLVLGTYKNNKINLF